MRSSTWFHVVAVLCFQVLFPFFHSAWGQMHDSSLSAYDSLAVAFRHEVGLLSSPELERRNTARRALQQQGYVETLNGVLRGDVLEALFSFVRMHLQLEFLLPHDQLYYYARVVPPPQRRESLPGFTTFGPRFLPIPLHEDWSFPADPWRKE